MQPVTETGYVPTQPAGMPPAAIPMAVPIQPVQPVQPVQPTGMPVAVPAAPAAPVAPVANAFIPTVTVSTGDFSQHLNVLNQCITLIFPSFLVGGLYIKQKVEKLEAVTGIETENKYKVYLTGPDCQRGKDQKPYFKAKEKSDFCQRQCCGNMREFEMVIEAPDDTKVLYLHRPFKCTCTYRFHIQLSMLMSRLLF